MKNKLLIVLSSILIFLFALTQFNNVSAQEVVDGTTLDVGVSGTAHWKISYKWSLDKSVSPDSWELFKGDAGVSTYTIAVAISLNHEAGFVDANVCVTNTGTVATEGLVLDVSVLDGITLLNSVNLVSGGEVTLAAGEERCFTPRINLSNPSDYAGKTLSISAEATITNDVDNPGTPVATSGDGSVVFPSLPATNFSSITVDDSNGKSWTFSDTGTVSYKQSFKCDADEGLNNNTATIRDTGKATLPMCLLIARI